MVDFAAKLRSRTNEEDVDPATGAPKNKRYILPQGEWMMVEMKTTEKFTPGGLELPESAVREHPFGVVRAVAEGESKYPVGTIVLVSPIGGVGITLQAVTYRVVRPEHIVAVMSEAEELSQEEQDRMLKLVKEQETIQAGRKAVAQDRTPPKLVVPATAAVKRQALRLLKDPD